MGDNTAAHTHKLARLPLVALVQAANSFAALLLETNVGAH
jgi:hypothetical protein